MDIFSGDNSKEPISEKRIQVSETVHKLVLSIAQDTVYVTPRGNIKSPKHVALPMTVKSKSGSSEIVTLLNQFGHGISYSVLREAETAMAERQTQRQEAGLDPCYPVMLSQMCLPRFTLITMIS